MLKQFLVLFLVFLAFSFGTYAQEGTGVSADSTVTLRKSRLIPLPALSSSPETGFTYGLFGSYYFDFAKGDVNTPMSSIKLIAVHSTKNMIVFDPTIELFTKNREMVYKFRCYYNRFSDRHYGRLNASETFVEYFKNDNNVLEAVDTFNYFRFMSDRIQLTASALKKVTGNFYVGPQYMLESYWRYRSIPDSVGILTAANESHVRVDGLDNPQLDTTMNSPMLGLRSGLGILATYDTRTNIDNPLQGSFVQFGSTLFTGLLGSKYNFLNLDLDARKYINTYKDQTLALRFVSKNNFNFDNTYDIPFYVLAKVGGRDFLRGYYYGTYQANHLFATEFEYRLPLFNDYDAPLKHIWKHFGITVFGGAAQVYDNSSDLALDQTRIAAGVGLRFMIDSKQRVNLRIDYGWGFNPDAAYKGKQSGFYFFLSEAF